MKIVLIWPRLEKDTNFPPLGMLYIAAVLEKEGHNLLLIDGVINKKELIQIKKFDPDLIGISITTSLEKNAKKVVGLLKGNIKKPIVLGGVHVTALMKDVFREFNVEYAVYGEGEYTMRDLCTALGKKGDLKKIDGLMYKKGKKIFVNKPREFIKNLDELPFPARHLLDFSWYLAPPGSIRGEWLKHGGTTIMASRGCPFQCIYCGSHTTFGRRVRRRSVENVINEIKLLKKEYNIDGLWVIDDTFTLDKEWVISLCKEIRREEIKLKWSCQFRVDTIDEELLKEMKKAGCVQVELGIESGSDKVLNALKKGFDTKSAIKAFKMIKKSGISSLTTFVVGSPEETKEDVMQTLRFAKKLNPDFALFFNLTPLPGTELYEMAKKNKWIQTTDYSRWFYFNEPVMTINIPKKEQAMLRNKLQDSFLLRNYRRLVFNPYILFNILMLFLYYPKAVVKGIKNILYRKNIDAFVYGFLDEYRMEIKRKQSIKVNISGFTRS